MSSTNDGAPFDEVFLDVQGRLRKITAEEFFALSIAERVRHVIERTVTFRLHGVPVEQKAALAAMRRYRAGAIGGPTGKWLAEIAAEVERPE
jgi:hypothetical protein